MLGKLWKCQNMVVFFFSLWIAESDCFAFLSDKEILIP